MLSRVQCWNPRLCPLYRMWLETFPVGTRVCNKTRIATPRRVATQASAWRRWPALGNSCSLRLSPTHTRFCLSLSLSLTETLSFSVPLGTKSQAVAGACCAVGCAWIPAVLGTGRGGRSGAGSKRSHRWGVGSGVFGSGAAGSRAGGSGSCSGAARQRRAGSEESGSRDEEDLDSVNDNDEDWSRRPRWERRWAKTEAKKARRKETRTRATADRRKDRLNTSHSASNFERTSFFFVFFVGEQARTMNKVSLSLSQSLFLKEGRPPVRSLKA